MGAADLAHWKRSVLEEAERTFAAADAARAALPEAARVLVDSVLAQRERLIERARALELPAVALAKTRYHGDLHLGQVLVAQDDFVIVDFEGEPARGFEERRRKGCVLRDVAGMLRSISYAADSAELRREPRAGASPEAAQAVLGAWERNATSAFLGGYRAGVAATASVPADDTAFAALLDLFVFEKALYELRYEMENRPDWIAIPVRGLTELALR